MKKLGIKHTQNADDVQHFDITDAPSSHTNDLHRRQIQYGLSQLFRIVCIILIFVIDNWPVRIILLVAAVIIPWIAVLRANDKDEKRGTARNSYYGQDQNILKNHDHKLPPR